MTSINKLFFLSSIKQTFIRNSPFYWFGNCSATLSKTSVRKQNLKSNFQKRIFIWPTNSAVLPPDLSSRKIDEIKCIALIEVMKDRSHFYSLVLITFHPFRDAEMLCTSYWISDHHFTKKKGESLGFEEVFLKRFFCIRKEFLFCGILRDDQKIFSHTPSVGRYLTLCISKFGEGVLSRKNEYSSLCKHSTRFGSTLQGNVTF